MVRFLKLLTLGPPFSFVIILPLCCVLVEDPPAEVKFSTSRPPSPTAWEFLGFFPFTPVWFLHAVFSKSVPSPFLPSRLIPCSLVPLLFLRSRLLPPLATFNESRPVVLTLGFRWSCLLFSAGFTRSPPALVLPQIVDMTDRSSF